MAEKSYFKKILLTTRVKLSSGKEIPWITVGFNTGALETGDSATIKELTKLAEGNKGGVIAIDQAAFEELKKNTAKPSPKLEWKPSVTATELDPLGKSPRPTSEKPAAAPAAAVEPKSDKPATATGVFPPDQPPLV